MPKSSRTRSSAARKHRAAAARASTAATPSVQRPLPRAAVARRPPAARAIVAPVPAAPVAATGPATRDVRLQREVPRERDPAARSERAAIAPMPAAISVTTAKPQRRRVVLLPIRNLRAGASALDASALKMLLSLQSHIGKPSVMLANVAVGVSPLSAAVTGGASLTVLDSLAENGAKLVEIDPSDEARLRASLPGVRVVPEVFYEPQSLRMVLESSLQPAGGGALVKVSVTAKGTGRAVKDVRVVAFTNFALRVGAEGRTAADGVATLAFPSKPSSLERVYAFADRGSWSALRHHVSTARPIAISLDPIDLAAKDGLRLLYGETPLTAGAGVTVGIIDTGCGPHPDLQVAGGFNAVRGEDATAFHDTGDLHGTHVAGIVAGRGVAPTGVRGLAPGVTLRSYRVFPKGKNASNFDIAKAIDRARLENCDVINLSLGRPASAPAGADEPLVRLALEDATEAGILPIVAAGNDFRQPVSFPASDDLSVAVSALGIRTLLPNGSTSAEAVAPPPGTDPNEFIAGFSNIGTTIDLTGPGVGIVSSVAPAGYGVMDGTSMAAPAVTGVAARLLAADSAILGMSRGPERAAAVAQKLAVAARRRGFPAELEGRGLAV